LVFSLYATIKMMHGPINIRKKENIFSLISSSLFIFAQLQ